MAPNSADSEVKTPAAIVSTSSKLPVFKRQLSQQVAEELGLTKPTYPYEWKPISHAEKMKRKEVYFANGPWCVSPKSSMLDLVVSKPGNFLMPRRFMALADTFFNFELRHDDVFVITYPKCGTTLTQELVWQIIHGMDVEGGRETLLTRSPFLEFQALCDPKVDTMTPKHIMESIAMCNNMTRSSPRVIKTHLPLGMLPPHLLDTCKVVFVSRNPMDCCVSFYHHERLVKKQGFAGTFDQYAELFRNGKNPTGDYFSHLMSGYSKQNHPNLKFLWFEDLKTKMPQILPEMCEFLGYSLNSEQMVQLESHLHIDNFRKNDAVNMTSNYDENSRGSFIRKGKVGEWRELFSDERLEDWKQWIADCTKGTDLSFDLSRPNKEE